MSDNLDVKMRIKQAWDKHDKKPTTVETVRITRLDEEFDVHPVKYDPDAHIAHQAAKALGVEGSSEFVYKSFYPSEANLIAEIAADLYEDIHG